jgi:hypothetical protein
MSNVANAELAAFRREVEAAAERWRIPLDKRRAIRMALDYEHVVASEVFHAEVQRCTRAELAVDRLRRVLEQHFVYGRVFSTWPSGEKEALDGWECALCEAHRAVDRESLVHTSFCPLFREVAG